MENNKTFTELFNDYIEAVNRVRDVQNQIVTSVYNKNEITDSGLYGCTISEKYLNEPYRVTIDPKGSSLYAAIELLGATTIQPELSTLKVTSDGVLVCVDPKTAGTNHVTLLVFAGQQYWDTEFAKRVWDEHIAPAYSPSAYTHPECPPALEPAYLSEREAAKMLGITQNTLTARRLAGRGPEYIQRDKGSRVWYRPDKVQAYMHSQHMDHPVKPSPENRDAKANDPADHNDVKISEKDAAKILGMDRKELTRLRYAGESPKFTKATINGRIWYKRQDLIDFIEETSANAEASE